METSTYLIKTCTPFLWILIACVGAALRSRGVEDRAGRLEIWQRWWAIVALGCGSVWMTVSFLTIGDYMADTIGFTRSPFQFEIAFANLALAVGAFRSASGSARERLTVGLLAAAFLWGATVGHVYQWFVHGDHQPGNGGGILVYDVGIPAVMIILAVVQSRQQKANPRDEVVSGTAVALR
ncbi:DUF6790 family protein [Kribbella kalugense]|uniref:DUF4345 domain-containing protein n=1 Tax=Kribbella kalugense TaxID=2512221 RepID=A0A4V6Q8I9_9ACTN|nr:DUF6790 family protein [Kribbella kalugense]TDW23994.1 hypothetical protein EV650_2855 [Kribbella kalugense]